MRKKIAQILSKNTYEETNHGKRMKGIAQGLLQASQIYSCFSKQEQTAINNILDRV